MFSPTAEQEQRGTGATMPVKIHYTPKGARYADWSNATPLEELELYRQRSAPKQGFVRYSPHARGPGPVLLELIRRGVQAHPRLLRRRKRRRQARRPDKG